MYEERACLAEEEMCYEKEEMAMECKSSALGRFANNFDTGFTD
jgi:hypothetical protein